ncbi:aldose epimerase [Falsiroseomonas bella]|uniref:Aldose epimerase n=1 Tax=Falsiroseomonas bella TaxID=2184016 RepID=A0A317FKV4_9PROT|nr:aldose 1-epimerase family protein [Falsiroseomonas bella]PWS38992.1 aldose epimerase [Falsiroseomonas bella]
MAREIQAAREGQDGIVEIGIGALIARVKPLGAELCSLRDAAGREFLWQAGEAWPRHAPILFPIVGRLHDDVLRLGEARHPIGQHGFARDLPFELVECDPAACRFRLRDNPATHAAYPFPFRLEVSYAVHEASLAIGYTVINPGEAPLPFCVGAHPAFCWPLPGAGPKTAHRLEFEQEESGPVYRPGSLGLLDPTPQPFPAHGRTLPLDDALFETGALVLLAPASRHVRFTAPGAPGLEVAWQGFEQLGIWMKPGAEFLCIEPWAGHADFTGQPTDFRRKPAVQVLEPGASASFQHRISLLG